MKALIKEGAAASAIRWTFLLNLDQTPDDFARRCFIELVLEIEFQVVSRIVPVMPWIRKHVDHEDHLCFKDNTDKKEKKKDKKG